METQFTGHAIVVHGEHRNLDTAMGWYVGMDNLAVEVIAGKFLTGVDPTIATTAKAGDILVGGQNFGFGKVHFAFWTAMRHIGIKCVVAESFSTQLIQTGMSHADVYFVECPDVLTHVRMGDELVVHLETAVVHNRTAGTTLRGKPFPPFLLDAMHAGGMMAHLRQRLAARTSQTRSKDGMA